MLYGPGEGRQGLICGPSVCPLCDAEPPQAPGTTASSRSSTPKPVVLNQVMLCPQGVCGNVGTHLLGIAAGEEGAKHPTTHKPPEQNLPSPQCQWSEVEKACWKHSCSAS